MADPGVKRSSPFVRDGEGKLWLPRPTSWIAGLARQRWFLHHLGPAHIAAPPFWEELARRWGVRTLEEREDGTAGEREGAPDPQPPPDPRTTR